MTDCAIVVSAYTDLRDGLSNLAMRTQIPDDRNVLLHRAVVSGNLAEQCDGKFAGHDVPNGDTAIDRANVALARADAAAGDDHDQNTAVIAKADQANATLSVIVGLGPFATG